MTKINFTGNIDDIKKQIEQSVATFELLGNRSSVNFEQWFNGWEKGFNEAIENRSLGNYSLTGENAWRSDASKWPRWRQWSNEKGILTGEYWLDKNQETDSIVLSGTAEQLIQHIIQLEYEGGGSSSKNEKINYLTTSRKGFPKIKIYFLEDILDVEPGYRALKTELKITIMKAEWKNISNISKNDIEQIAKAVKNVFYNFVIKKGKLTCSYKNLEQGYDNWTYVRTREEGKRIMTAVVNVLGHTLDRKFLKFTETDDEAGAYPIVPEPITAFGEQIKTSRRRPIAETKFTHATISLPGLTEPLRLVDSAGGTFKSTDNLV